MLVAPFIFGAIVGLFVGFNTPKTTHSHTKTHVNQSNYDDAG